MLRQQRMRQACAGIVLVAILLLTGGCVSSGKEVDTAKYEAFVIGKTTYAEVLAQLGEPTTNTVDGKGERMAVYTYVKSAARPESFIPVVGLLVAGADAKATSVALQFNAAGILKDKATSTSNTELNTGLINGAR